MSLIREYGENSNVKHLKISGIEDIQFGEFLLTIEINPTSTYYMFVESVNKTLHVSYHNVRGTSKYVDMLEYLKKKLTYSGYRLISVPFDEEKSDEIRKAFEQCGFFVYDTKMKSFDGEPSNIDPPAKGVFNLAFSDDEIKYLKTYHISEHAEGKSK